ncbi:MAG TPA: hypothetical protein VNM36_03540 [Gemmatimonadaceae bacterium]|nr:hypothetical protein [Gemmatimonadaceae bacterium]
MPLKRLPLFGVIMCLAFLWPVTVRGDTVCIPGASVPDAVNPPGTDALHASHSTQSRGGPHEATYPNEWCGDDSSDLLAGECGVEASRCIKHRDALRLRREVLPWVRDLLLPFATAPPAA